MIMPYEMKPEQSIYYNGSIVIKYLKQYGKCEVGKLYMLLFEKKEMTFKTMMLSLDWLFAIDAIKYSKGGIIELCLSNH